jgi:hypothetical protein
MNMPEQGSLRATLADMSREGVDEESIYRTLIEYDQWLVPLGLIHALSKRDSFPTLYFLDNHSALPVDRVWIFSDFEAVLEAQRQGIEPGPCVGGVEGTELFGSLGPQWAEVFVNPGSPVNESAYIRPHPEHGYFICSRFAAAIRLEKIADQITVKGPTASCAGIRAHEELILLLMSDSSFLTGYDEARTVMSLLVFTAPDRLRAFTKSVADQRLLEGSRAFPLDGARIIEAARMLKYHAIHLNPGSPRGCCWLPLTLFDQE